MASKLLESDRRKQDRGHQSKRRPRKELDLERYRELRAEELAVIWLSGWLEAAEPRAEAAVPRVPTG